MRRPGARRGWATVALAVVLAGCAAPARDPLVAQSILDVDSQAAFTEAREARRLEVIEQVLDRAARIARGETADDTFDLLLLSGGADWGAFGAGYLARWHELGADAAIPMPEFDLVAGISTGALIGTYVAAGTPERYAGIETFYRATDPGWVVFPGIGRLLPRSQAVFDNTGIRREVAQAVDDRLLAELRSTRDTDRLVLALTTNLDFGRLQVFDMGAEATRPEPHERIVDVLMAATAIPGAFAPVEIDGHLHADGGAVQGVPGIDPTRLPELADRWAERHPNERLPLIRFWFVFNNQLGLQPEPIRPSWFGVMFRSYQTISQTSFRAPVQTSVLAAKGAEATGAPPSEVRWIAIPETFVPVTGGRPFDPRITNALADLGRAVAEAPDGGWRSDFPR
ncbi:MAG: patatin-like phospholipase family protein [Pseudomonadota bacterium]